MRLVLLFLLVACDGEMHGSPDGGARDRDGGSRDRDGGGRDAGVGLDSALFDTGGDPPALDECASPPADWIFCDSFESGVTYDGDTREPALIDEPGPFGIAGNHAAQFRVPAGRGGRGIYKELETELETAYLRFYVKWEAGHDFTAPRHGPGGLHGGPTDCLGCSGSRPSEWFTSTLETVTDPPHTVQAYTYYPGMYMDCSDPSGSCWGDMFPCTAGPSYCTNPAHAARGDEPAMETDRWYCFEQMIDVGTTTSSESGANGVLDYWIDGVEIGPWDGLWFRSSDDTRVSAMWLYMFHHEDHSEEGILFDNIVVSRSRVGCP
jgi:hypothetical protein